MISCDFNLARDGDEKSGKLNEENDFRKSTMWVWKFDFKPETISLKSTRQMGGRLLWVLFLEQIWEVNTYWNFKWGLQKQNNTTEAKRIKHAIKLIILGGCLHTKPLTFPLHWQSRFLGTVMGIKEANLKLLDALMLYFEVVQNFQVLYVWIPYLVKYNRTKMNC